MWSRPLIDSSICDCVITAGLIGREEHRDIVITDTPGQPLALADGRRDGPAHGGFMEPCTSFGEKKKRISLLCRPYFCVCGLCGLRGCSDFYHMTLVLCN